MSLKHSRVLIILALAYSLTLSIAAATSGPVTPPEITFQGTEVVTGGIKFTYHVKRGTENLNYWELYSCAFNAYDIIDSSETVHLPDSKEYIRFTKPYNKEPYERDVWFVLEMDYTNLLLVEIPYLIKCESNEYDGTILGPACPDFVIPENNMGTIGTLASMALAGVLLGFLRARGISFLKKV